MVKSARIDYSLLVYCKYNPDNDSKFGINLSLIAIDDDVTDVVKNVDSLFM